MNKNKIVYKLTVEDIQTVADEMFDRNLSNEEIEKVEDRIGDYINWYDAIENAINDSI